MLKTYIVPFIFYDWVIDEAPLPQVAIFKSSGDQLELDAIQGIKIHLVSKPDNNFYLQPITNFLFENKSDVLEPDAGNYALVVLPLMDDNREEGHYLYNLQGIKQIHHV